MTNQSPNTLDTAKQEAPRGHLCRVHRCHIQLPMWSQLFKKRADFKEDTERLTLGFE